MKSFYYVLCLLWLSHFTFAQTSDKGFSFQGYAIDQDGKAIGSTGITVRFTLSPASGTGTYVEEHVLTSDPFGVFTAIVGKGTKQSGDDFKTLDYTRKDIKYRLKVEVRKTSGGVYATISDAELNAVPYARKAENGVPVGTIIAFAGPKTKIPDGWALCDGSQRDGTAADWKQLYDMLGTSWGGSGTNFNLPDLRGMFLRGVNDGRTGTYSDPNAAARTAQQAGGNTADNVGSVQTDQFRQHTHTATSSTDGSHTHTWNNGTEGDDSGSGGSNDEYTRTGGTVTDAIQAAGNHSHTITVQNSGGSETRPINAGVFYIIKY